MPSKKANIRWTNESVLAYSNNQDPILKIESDARKLVFNAIERGWTGPPYDPIKLAELLKIKISAEADVRDAQTVPKGKNSFEIQYNPNRPRGRIRFSVAHEIAHTFFPDCATEVQERHNPELDDDKWQLEMLCNIAAAEIVMPIGSMKKYDSEILSLEELINIRKVLDVSTEAILLRHVKLTGQPIAMFCASYNENRSNRGKHLINYSIGSTSWPHPNIGGSIISSECLLECTAIGYQVKDTETWNGIKLDIECVGLPPYPGTKHPRIAGIIRSYKKGRIRKKKLNYQEGNALNPGGNGKKIIAHIVNDKTPNWGGGGFAVSLKRKYPDVQTSFRDWILENRENLDLGKNHLTSATEDTMVVSMIAQHGYGASELPRIRYNALEECLDDLGDYANTTKSSVHMPRIGTGNAGGDWAIIEELIQDNLINKGVLVNIYDFR